MPKYEFKCNKCDLLIEEIFTFKEVEHLNGNWPETDCDCGGKLIKQFSIPDIVTTKDKIKPIPVSRHSEDWKKKRAAEADIAIYNEGFQSQSEMKEAMDMAAEEEKKRKDTVTPGGLTTGVSMPTTKEGVQAVKDRVKRKINQSRKQRGEH